MKGDIMTTLPSQSQAQRRVSLAGNFETKAWLFMRYSALLLIPLAFGHLILQDVIVGVHNIDIDYVADRWALTSWRIYDALLLVFAFAHGMNGLRQVMMDYIHNENTFRVVSWLILIAFIVISAIGAFAIIAFAPPV
jgi:succinate dehydrogenase / fumarate reductase, membrane anchor subunit